MEFTTETLVWKALLQAASILDQDLYRYIRHLDLRQVQWLNGRPDRQRVGREHLVPAGCHERQTCLCDTSDTSRPRRLSSSSRNSRPPPSRDTRRSRVLSILHPNPRQRLPNGHPQQTVSFPGAYNDNDPGIYDPSIYSPGAAYTFPGGPVSNLASPADMTGQLSGNGSSSSPPGNTYPSPTAKNGKPTSTDGSGVPPTGIAQSSLDRVCKLQMRDTPLSRRDTGTTQHMRHMSFMRAIRDAFYHS